MTVTKTLVIENCTSVEDLQLQLRNCEVRLKLKTLTFRQAQTRKFARGVFERIPAQPLLPDLRVALDPNEDLSPEDDEELVCRGTACIALTKTKVAAFRKKP